MRDTFPCVCKYVVLSNTYLKIIRSLSACIWPAGTDNSVLLLLSSPSELTQYTSYCSAGVKLTQWTSSCVYCCCQAHTVDIVLCVLLLSSSHSGRHMTTRRVIGLVILAHVVMIYTVSEIIHIAYCTASVQ